MKPTPLSFFVFLFLALSLLALPLQTEAKPKVKAVQANDAPLKEKLVLMPLRVGKEIQNMRGPMETALVEGLAQKYRVYSGDEVELKTKEIYSQETQRANSAKKDCDETRCLQDIAIAFKAEYIAIATVIKTEGGYLLALNIRGMSDNKDVGSRSLTCKGCDAFQVIDKLKELSGASQVTAYAPVTATPSIPEPAAPAVSGSDPESMTWNEAQKGNTVDDYQVYLDTYPKGKYVPFAKAKIKKLNDVAQAAQEQQEQSAWDAAQQESSENSLNRYLQGYPNGRFVGFAKTRLNKLKTDQAAKEESELWQKAENGNDKAAVEAYLNRYPAGRYLAAASAKLQAIKAEEAKGPRPGLAFKDCNDCAEMVVIPAGSFTMGGSSSDEAPAHRVTIGKPFAIGKTEVTQAQWQAVMGNNPSTFTNCGGNCPVEQVSWDDVQSFIQRLNQKTGKNYRLPTEAEWEYACRAGGQSEYCGGDDVNAVAWYGAYANPVGNSAKTTNPVATKQANAFGLYDMSGNVWEWVQDSYHGNYNGAPNDGSEWSGDGGRRVLRGGSWNLNPYYSRSAYRYFSPYDRNSDIGFRVARTLP